MTQHKAHHFVPELIPEFLDWVGRAVLLWQGAKQFPTLMRKFRKNEQKTLVSHASLGPLTSNANLRDPREEKP